MIWSTRSNFGKTHKPNPRARACHNPYQASTLLIEGGRNPSRGDTVGFVKVRPFKRNGKIFTVRPAIQARANEVNVEDYVRNLRSSLGQTFEPMGISLVAKGETRLSEFAE